MDNHRYRDWDEYDEYLSDVSLEADDSGIDACEARRPVRVHFEYDPEDEEEEDEESSSSGESNAEAERLMHVRENRARLAHARIFDRFRLQNLEQERNGDKYGLQKVMKLYEPITAAELERGPMGKKEKTDDEESLLEVELTASGEEDEDSSVLELVIPMQNKFPQRSRLGVLQMICRFFCCKPFK